jgi:hypothetical protein
MMMPKILTAGQQLEAIQQRLLQANSFLAARKPKGGRAHWQPHPGALQSHCCQCQAPWVQSGCVGLAGAAQGAQWPL